MQYGWSRIGQVRSIEPQAHRQRVNVLGALRQDGKLVWCAQQRPTVQTDVIAFLDHLSEGPHASPRIVVIDNAAIHKLQTEMFKNSAFSHGKAVYLIMRYCDFLYAIDGNSMEKQRWEFFLSERIDRCFIESCHGSRGG